MASYLALRAASRMWELPSWQSYYSLAPSDWPRLREVVRQALADGPLTLEELGAAITARPQFRHLSFAFDGNPWTLLKAFAWQGDLSFGPAKADARRFSASTATLAGRACPSSTRPGCVPSRRTSARMGRRRPTASNTGLGKAWAPGASGSGAGSPASVIASWRWRSRASPHLSCASISRTWPRRHRPLPIRLLPGYDQWVLGPGTADAHVVPPGRRCARQPSGQSRDRRRRRVRDVGIDRTTTSPLTGSRKQGRSRKETARGRGRAPRHDPGSAPSAFRPDRMTSRLREPGHGQAIRMRYRSADDAPSETPPNPDRALAEQRRHRRHG